MFKTQRWVDRVLSHVGVSSSAPGSILIGIELHGHGLITPGW